MPRTHPSTVHTGWTRMWGNLFRNKRSPQASIRETLAGVPLFQDLSPKELKKIEDLVYLRAYRAGEAVFRQGEPGLGMYIIHQGSVLIQGWGHDSQEEDGPVLTLEKGDFFGDMTLLEEHPHMVTARANASTKLLGFFRPDFLALIQHHPRLGSRLLLSLGRVIAMRFRESMKNLENEGDDSASRDGS